MRLALAALILAATAAAPDDPKKDDAIKGDLKLFQGKWETKVGPDESIPVKLEIKGNKITVVFTADGEDRTMEGEIKLDESKSPKELDFTDFHGPDGQNVDDNRAIYKFDGDDKVIVCSGGPGRDRPTEFKGGSDGEGPNLHTLARVK